MNAKIANQSHKTAIVTGAARGMGRAMAAGLLRAGYAVAAVDNHAPSLEELMSAMRAEGRDQSLLTIEIDLTRPDAAAEILSRSVARFGQVDILVNNAGIGRDSIWQDNWKHKHSFFDIQPDQWRRFFEVNVHAHFMMVHTIVPRMIEQGWGRVVANTTSLSTMLVRGGAPYGQPKAAHESMMAAMSAELEGTGVTANVLVPGGLTNTSMVTPTTPVPRSEMIQPEAMVPPLLWLISDDAADINAQRIVARRWDMNIPPREALKLAGAPIGWSTAGSEAVRPLPVIT